MTHAISNSLSHSKLADIDPQVDFSIFKISAEEIKNRQSNRKALHIIANHFKDFLSQTVMMQNILIADEDGWLLYLCKTDNDTCINELNISPGISFSVDIIGTNALGLALKYLRCVEVKGENHFLNKFKKSTSYGVPILKDDILIGTIGTVYNQDIENSKMRMMEEILLTTLEGALNVLKTIKLSEEIILIKSVLAEPATDALLVINSFYDIVEANSLAELYLNTNKDNFINKSILKFLSPEYFGAEKKVIKQRALKKPSNNTKYDISITPVPYQERFIGWRIDFSSYDANKIQFKDIIGKSKQFTRAIKVSKTVSKSPSTVLITGESGTGKELFANSIHNASQQANGPFITVNCASIPKDLFESELFGYYEGAFTGAKKGGMQGLLVRANNGTLFLDEIGDMPLDSQAKLLKVLQDRIVLPLGEGKPIPIHIRVIAATNRDLEELVKKKEFRLDLFYRINVIHIKIPPLRERKDDIPILVRHFIEKYRPKINPQIHDISPEALEYLKSYDWPGNVRELENIIEAAFNLTEYDIIELSDLTPFLNIDVKNCLPPIENGNIQPLDYIVEKTEKEYISNALVKYDWNISQVANILRIGRGTLYRKIEKYGLLEKDK